MRWPYGAWLGATVVVGVAAAVLLRRGATVPSSAARDAVDEWRGAATEIIDDSLVMRLNWDNVTRELVDGPTDQVAPAVLAARLVRSSRDKGEAMLAIVLANPQRADLEFQVVQASPGEERTITLAVDSPESARQPVQVLGLLARVVPQAPDAPASGPAAADPARPREKVAVRIKATRDDPLVLRDGDPCVIRFSGPGAPAGGFIEAPWTIRNKQHRASQPARAPVPVGQ